MGLPGPAPATILNRGKALDDDEPDPIYGLALRETWRLLNEKSSKVQEGKEERKVIDFGFEALVDTLENLDDLSLYLAPKPDAPILLPAHLDLFSQTAPTPHPEPDVQVFLHGKQRGAPEARVVWRADLSENNTENWKETVALCPPGSGESLSVPLYRLRTWLISSVTADDTGDVEGTASSESEAAGYTRPCLVWRGMDRSEVCRDPSNILPNDVVVLPAGYGITGLGQSAPEEAMGEHTLDLWEPVRATSGHPPAIRLHRDVLQPWLACPPLKELVISVEDPAWEHETLLRGIDSVLNYQPAADDSPAPPPPWLLDLLRVTRTGRVEEHPSGGVILFARENARIHGMREDDLFADDDDMTSASGREVSLLVHSNLVERAVEKLARRCLPDELLDSLRLAARWHDAGKLDERFQILLRHGNEVATVTGEPLAKSAAVPTSPERRRAIRAATHLPFDFRHEMLSAYLAERYAGLPESNLSELTLHLIASHHGHARPFAPISPDPEPPPVSGHIGTKVVELTGDARKNLVPPHRFDSGLSEHFWRLTRRYGWWGLAYLEAIVRLGDWYGSEFTMKETDDTEMTS